MWCICVRGESLKVIQIYLWSTAESDPWKLYSDDFKYLNGVGKFNYNMFINIIKSDVCHPYSLHRDSYHLGKDMTGALE